MQLVIPPFSFHRVPEPHEMAEKLACAVPEEERGEAVKILVEHILTVKLAGIDQHPRPERLTAVVYKELTRVISGHPPNMRLHALRLYAFEVYIQYMVREATNLAIARYRLEHPRLDPQVLERWDSPQVKELELLAPADIADIARRSLDGVEQWRARIAESYPAEWSKHRDSHNIVSLALEAAATGEYQRAAGQLHQFLSDLGVALAPQD